MPRKSKFGPHIVEAFKQILSDDKNVICGTDEDLFFLLNRQLPQPERISYRSFQRYKALALSCGMDDEFVHPDYEEEYSEYFDPIYQELYILFRLALFNQKKALMSNMLEDEKGWRKWQWILERKFREWNLRWTSAEADRGQADVKFVESTVELPPIDPQEPPEPWLKLVYVDDCGRQYDLEGHRLFPFDGEEDEDDYGQEYDTDRPG